MKVLVTGVNGLIGGRVAAELHGAGVDVIGGTSRPESTTDRSYPVVRVDLTDPASLRPVLDRVDRAFVYPAAEAADELAGELAEAALQRVVVLSSASVLLPEAGVIAAGPRAVEHAMTQARVPNTTLLRPDVFAANALDWLDGVRAGKIAVPFPDARQTPVHEADVVDAAVVLLTSQEGPGTLTLTGPESLSQQEQIAIMADVLGTTVDVLAMTAEQWRRSTSFLPDEVAESLLAIWSGSVDAAGEIHTIRQLTDAAPRTFRDWAVGVLQAAGGAA